MKPILAVALLAGLVASGCATHNHYRHGDTVTLVLRKSDARQVWLLSSLDRFKPRPARRVAGRWEVTLPATETFRYFYRVDGAPFVPDCPLKEKDDFGAENCVFDPTW